MQPASSTDPSGGIPSGLRRKAADAVAGAADMTAEAWRGLVGGLLDFFAEEAAEPEHAADKKDAEAEHVVTIAYNGDFDMAGLLRHLHHLGSIGASRAVTAVDADDKPVNFGWDGDGADKIVSAELDGVDLLKKAIGAHDAAAAKTLYVNRPLKNAAALTEWARKAGFKKTLPGTDMHVTVAFSKTPLAWPASDGGDVTAPDAGGDLNGTRSVERLGAEGAVVLRFESPDLARRWQELRGLGASWDHPEYRPHVTFTMDDGDFDVSVLEPYAGPLEFGPEEFDEVGGRAAGWAKKARESMVGDEDTLQLARDDYGPSPAKIDREHDGPWMSCMSKDRGTMYVNKNLPDSVDIKDRTVDVANVLWNHEGPESKDLENLIQVFKEQAGREPNEQERKVLYAGAHGRSGTPNERAFCKENGIDWDAWSAWCRGEESKIEKGPFTNEPADADVKPIPHGHGDLAATDSALSIALDRDSVREFDKIGRLKVKVVNLSKACVNPYVGHEIPGWEELGLERDKIYQLLRDPEELRRATDTFNGVQLLRKHIPVTPDDPQQWDVVGTTGSDAEFDDTFLKNSLFVWTAEGINLIESGDQQELSCGYLYKPDMTPGSFRGVPYDGVMRDIFGNHVALVENGRAGRDVVVGDSAASLQWAIVEGALLDFAANA